MAAESASITGTISLSNIVNSAIPSSIKSAFESNNSTIKTSSSSSSSSSSKVIVISFLITPGAKIISPSLRTSLDPSFLIIYLEVISVDAAFESITERFPNPSSSEAPPSVIEMFVVSLSTI